MNVVNLPPRVGSSVGNDEFSLVPGSLTAIYRFLLRLRRHLHKLGDFGQQQEVFSTVLNAVLFAALK